MNQWCTISVTPEPGPDLRPGRTPAEVLDDLAGLLALEPGVLGVEIAGPDTWGAPAPHLVVHAEPRAATGIARAAEALAARFGLRARTAVEHHEGDDYLDAWRAYHPPIPCGRRGTLLVRPSWVEDGGAQAQTVVVLDPGRAFGTGRHASTRLCLDWIADHPPPHPATVLDLGCGSGVLAVAAALHFGATVVAVDVDAEAVATTRENAAANGVWVQAVEADLAGAPRGPFDCVLANIRTEVLVPGAAEIAARIAPGGVAVLSGILDEEAPAVLGAVAAAGCRAEVAGRREGWCAVVARKEDPAP